MNSPLRTRRAEWLVTAPSFLWLALFFAVPAVIVLAFTFHGHDISGGVGEWSLSTWRELVDPDYPTIIWNTIRISVEVTIWSIVLAVTCAYAIARGTDRMCSFGDWIALSDVCDETTATIIKREVSDGVIAPGYTEEALAILKAKRKGSYNVVQMDPDYVPDPQEIKQVFGITFEQGRNNFKIDRALLSNIVTANKDLPDDAAIDLIVALITLKYTQSNSVCFAVDGQAIGVGAGQQSRVHCTRLAGSKADTWLLRQSDKVLNLPFKEGLGRADRDNAIDGYINQNELDVCAEGNWQRYFSEQPEPFTKEEQKAYLATIDGIALGSDAFFPFDDNIERAKLSGVKYIAEPGGSVRDDLVIGACDKYGMVMAFTGMRLFHH